MFVKKANNIARKYSKYPRTKVAVEARTAKHIARQISLTTIATWCEVNACGARSALAKEFKKKKDGTVVEGIAYGWANAQMQVAKVSQKSLERKIQRFRQDLKKQKGAPSKTDRRRTIGNFGDIQSLIDYIVLMARFNCP